MVAASGVAYIDLTSGDDAAAGTEVAPWLTFTNITSEANVYIKRGTTGNIGAEPTKSIVSVDGMTVGAYDTGDDPIIQNYLSTSSGSWVEVSATDGETAATGSNLWRYPLQRVNCTSMVHPEE